MARRSPLRINKLLARMDPSIRRVLETSEVLRQLQAVLERLLPANLASHCRLANYKDNVLFLYTTSSAWATRIRLEAPQLREYLSRYQEFKNIQQVRVRIDSSPSIAAHKLETLQISTQSAKIINELAENINVPELADALKRLARRGRAS